MMEHLDLTPIRSARGVIALPGSKSISNRTLLLAALADGDTGILGLLSADDTQVMLTALRLLGVTIDHRDGNRDLLVHGTAGSFPVKDVELYLGNAGTAFRPLTAALALADGHYRLWGVKRMHERPIGDLVDALRLLGAQVTYEGNDGYPPLRIEPRRHAPLLTQVRGDVSSQFLSALLMAMPLVATQQDAHIEVIGDLISKPYVEITLNLMQRFGVTVERAGWERFVVRAGQRYRSPGVLTVEGDASSASYFLGLGAIAGGPVRVTGVGSDSIQGDVRFVDVLKRMGARVEMDATSITVSGVNVARGEKLFPIDADMNAIPDAAMTAAVLALFADGPSTLRNIGSWRVKETDRIDAMRNELRKLGANVEAGADYLRIEPPVEMRSAAIDTYDDHRMAMSFSLAACGSAHVRINDPGCVAKTFPDYFDQLAALVNKR